MISIIDMTTGETLYTSSPVHQCEASLEKQGPEHLLPALALQEIPLESRHTGMPPELAQVCPSSFLAQFD